jgi:peptidoglycan-associated lipoprotein
MSSLHWLAGALGAGVTAFAAIKLAEGRASEPPLMYLGVLFLTLAIFSAFAAGFCLIRLQWQYDLLNRYIATKKGGQYYGPSPPIDPTHEMRHAWPVVKTIAGKEVDERDCEWPVYEETGYRVATLLALCAAMVLLAYLWTPLWLARPDAAGKGDNKKDGGKVSRAVLLHTTLFFESGRSALSPAAERSLRDAVKGLMPLDERCVLVEGHTDERASAEYNLALGRMRAETVLSVLDHEGVPRASILVSSFGESHPAASGHSQTDLAQNRRVELSLTSCPKTAPTP